MTDLKMSRLYFRLQNVSDKINATIVSQPKSESFHESSIDQHVCENEHFITKKQLF